MTQVENLDENLLPSLNDWIPIQSPGQKIKKVKIENLPINLDTTALQSEIDQKADIDHFHTQFSDLQQQIDTKASQSVVNDKANSSDVTNALATKVDATAYANTVSVLEQSINNKAPSVHGHPISSITNLQTALDNKVDKGNAGFTAFRSQSPPTNKNIGDRWYQLNSSNLPINEWTWDGTYWRGNFQDYRLDNSFNPNAGLFLRTGLDNRYGYYLESLYYDFYQQARPTDNTSYWAFNFARRNADYSTVGNFFAVREFRSKAAEFNTREAIDLNTYLNLTTIDTFNLGFNITRFIQSGFAMPSGYFNFVLRYQVIYK